MNSWERSKDVVARRVAGETVLVPVGIRRSEDDRPVADLFVLNETGEQLWQWLSSPMSADQLAQKLIAEYDVSLDAARGDVEEFLASMHAIAAIRTTESQ